MSLTIILNCSSIILLNVYFFISLYSIGSLVNKLLDLRISNNKQIIWVGLFAMCILLMICHFFFPINFRVSLAIFTILFLNFVIKFKHSNFEFLKLSKLNILSLIFYLLCLFILTKQEPLYDTGLYHLQAIKWFNEEEIIPGIANLNDRLGFNIISYYLSSYLIFPFFESLAHISVSLFIFVLAFVTILNLNFQNIKNSYWIKCSALVGLSFKRYLVPSASPDLITFSLEIIIVLYLIQIIFEENKVSDNFRFLIFICSFLYMIKLSSIFFSIVFFTLLFLLSIKNKITFFHKKLFFFIVLVTLIWITRGYILSGMPFYPNTLLAIEFFDWSVNIEDTKNLAKNFYNWSVNNFIISEKKLSLLKYFDQWILSFPLYIKLYIILIVVFFLFSLGKYNKNLFSKLAPIIIALIMNILFVVFTLPQPRFIESSILSLFVLSSFSFYYCYQDSLLIKNMFLNRLLFLIILILFILVCFFKSVDTFSSIWKSDNKIKIDNIKIVNNNNLTISMPIKGDQCWDWQLPCSFSIKKDLNLKSYLILNRKVNYFSTIK